MFCNIGKFKKYVGKKFLIRSKKDEKFVIDSDGYQKEKEGGVTHIWEDSYHVNQAFTVDCMGHLLLADRPKCVLYVEETSDGSRLCITSDKEIGADAYGALARWTLTKEGEIVSQANPDQMLNISGGAVAKNSFIVMWHKQDSSALNDKWKIDVIGGFDEEGYKPDIGKLSSFVDSKFYIRIQENERICVDSDSTQKKKGGETHLWTDDGSKNPNQIWTVDKYGHIINAENPDAMMALVPKKCLKGSSVSCAKLNKTGLFYAPIACWSLNEAGELTNLGDPSLILNVKGGAIKNGSPVILWTRQDKSAKNDKWTLTKA